MTEDEVPGMAAAIEARRRALGLSPGAFAEAAGLTRQGAGNVRAGRRRQYQDATILGVARALRWAPDWYERLLRGEPLVEVEELEAPAPDERLDRLEKAVDRLTDRFDRLSDLIERAIRERP